MVSTVHYPILIVANMYPVFVFVSCTKQYSSKDKSDCPTYLGVANVQICRSVPSHVESGHYAMIFQ